MTASLKINPQTSDFQQGNLQARLYISGIKGDDAPLGYIGNLVDLSNGGKISSPQERCDFVRGAKNRLFAMGANKIIGPVDGDTWHRYRLPLGGSETVGFLEPNYGVFAPEDFIGAGMEVIATYRTCEVQDPSLALEKLASPEILDQKSLRKLGVTVRGLRIDAFEEEMAAMHQFSLEAFKENYLYSPIGFDAFRDLYLPIKPLLREQLVLIAEATDAFDLKAPAPAKPWKSRRESVEKAPDNVVLGVVLAVPDPRDRSTIIVKTLARHRLAPRGLGQYLFYEVLARGHQLGFRRAECALMKDDNFSAFLPEQVGGTLLRRFALFGTCQ